MHYIPFMNAFSPEMLRAFPSLRRLVATGNAPWRWQQYGAAIDYARATNASVTKFPKVR